MDSDHYYCDLLYFNTGKRWRCEDITISEFSGYPDSVYDELSHEDIHKKKYIFI